MVEAIASSMDAFNNFEMMLTSFGTVDLDQLLVNLIQDPNSSNSSPLRMAEKKIDLAIHIKHVISLVDQLKQTLQDCNQLVFNEYIEQLSHGDFKSIQEMIDGVINAETKFTKGNANMNLQKTFAIKDKFNALLDLARSVYSDSIEDVIALTRTYGTSTDSVRLAFFQKNSIILRLYWGPILLFNTHFLLYVFLT